MADTSQLYFICFLLFKNRVSEVGFLKLDGVAPLIADPPPLKLHQQAKSTPSVKWP